MIRSGNVLSPPMLHVCFRPVAVIRNLCSSVLFFVGSVTVLILLTGVFQSACAQDDADHEQGLKPYGSYQWGDIEAARQRGVSPGGDVFVHGLPNGYGWVGSSHRLKDWTDGCIAVTNAEMDEIWRAVADGTPIEIRP